MRTPSLLAAALLTASPAAAEYFAPADRPCGDLGKMAGYLISEYGELPIVGGTVIGSTELGFFANPQTGTWTLLETTDGRACVLAIGTGAMVLGQEV